MDVIVQQRMQSKFEPLYNPISISGFARFYKVAVVNLYSIQNFMLIRLKNWWVELENCQNSKFVPL